MRSVVTAGIVLAINTLFVVASFPVGRTNQHVGQIKSNQVLATPPTKPGN